MMGWRRFLGLLAAQEVKTKRLYWPLGTIQYNSLREDAQAEDEIDRILQETYKFRRLSQAEVDQLSEEETERLQDDYAVARAREIKKAVRQGRMEVVSGQDLKEELDRICGQKV